MPLGVPLQTQREPGLSRGRDRGQIQRLKPLVPDHGSTASLKRMRKKSVVDRTMTTGAEPRIDFQTAYAALKRRSSTVAQAFRDFFRSL